MSSAVYRRDIDGLRALAVVPVVLNHAGVPGVSGGFVGVDVFFVISGFLISGILLGEVENGRYSIVNFYERRARRILPALLFLLAAISAALIALGMPTILQNFARSSAATLLFISNFWFFRGTTDYFAIDSHTEPLLHTWSLAVEEQFYILFPILLWLLMPYGRFVMRAAMGVIVGLSFALAVATVPTHPEFAFYLPFTRIRELGAGVLLALGLFPQTRRSGVLESVSAVGLILLVGAILFIDDETPFPGLAALAPVVGTAAVIWAGTDRQTVVSRLLSNRVLVWIGLISYSLYLWHWPILVGFRLRLGSHDIPGTLAAVAIAMSFVAAWVSWRFIELPFRRRGDKGFSRRTILLGSVLGISFMLSVSALVEVTSGLRAFASARVVAILDQASRDESYFECSAAEGFCAIGAPDGAPVALVWGDSHASASAPGFETYFGSRGEKAELAAMRGCAPLIDLYRVDEADATECIQHNLKTLEHVKSHPSIRTVVLVGRWPLVVEGTRVPGEESGEAILRIVDGARPEGAANDNVTAFTFGIGRTLTELAAAGVKVIVIAGYPEIGRMVPEAVALAEAFGAPTPQGPSLADTVARHARANAIIREHLVDGDIFIDPVPLMCGAFCAIERDGLPLYRDDDHLSDFGARTIVPALMAAAE